MARSIDYLWRLIATGFSFALFGLGSILLWSLLFPLIAPLLGRGNEKKRRSRRLMREVFRIYVGVMECLGLFSFDRGDHLKLNRPGRVIVANHPSLLDVVLLISVVRNATCIVKPALQNNVFMRAPIRAVHYLYASVGPALPEQCARELREGSSLIIFPEGTRSTTEDNRPFQRGAANIALLSAAPLLPVYIRCSPPTLKKHEKWYRIPPSRVSYSLHVGEEIDPVPFAQADDRSLAARKLTRLLQTRFAEQALAHQDKNMKNGGV
jgi:1-acyl-sn-glycerol-3-phosphate acyltransferase